MSALERALAFVLDAEGGYVHDPQDPGGETKYGISKHTYPQLDVAALTRDQAAGIYRRDFWQRLRLGDLPGPVAMAVMDSAVNCGPDDAAMFLQRAYNELSQGDRIKEDGILGPVTRFAVNAWCGGAATCRAHLLAQRLLDWRQEHYIRLAMRQGMRFYFLGWTRRVGKLRGEITAGAGWPPA